MRTDGSRPSFLVRDGDIDRDSSPVGTWASTLDSKAAKLRTAIASVGRIDVPGTSVGFQGTGFIVSQNAIITNRHVLQVIASQQADGSWQLFPNVAIDFGHDFEARESVNRRLLKRVQFAGSKPIVPNNIDHTKLDLALIELEPRVGGTDQVPFDLQISPTLWGNLDVTIFTIGYPGNPPPFVYPPALLDQLFESTFGSKRIAPGGVIASPTPLTPWTIRHDTTTLGGSSGSTVFVLDSEGFAAGLHYGGRPAGPAENWCHKLENVLNVTDGRSSLTLHDVLQANGVRLSGRLEARVEPPVDATRTTPPPVVTANRQAIVTLPMMKRLHGDGATRLEAAELEASQNGETPAAQFTGRGGYDPNFLPGFTVPLPTNTRNPQDMRTLRRGGSGVELKYEHFSVIMSASRRMTMVTGCNIDGGESRRLPRVRNWNFDGRLNPEDQLGNDLYRGNDIDRGHMVRREDPVWGTQATASRANVDTFHYTNSCPQMAGVNQVTWLGLENYILNHTREDAMRVSVFTGPFFTDDDFPYRGAKIPKSFWKVVAFLLDDGRPSATAYRVSQANELQELEFVFAGFQTFQISVQQVQDATGLDFSAMIPFDGFSQHERVHGTILTERIERLEQIRV